MRQAADWPGADRITGVDRYDWNDPRLLGRERRRMAGRDDNIDLARREFGDKLRQAVNFPPAPRRSKIRFLPVS
jgi:hypothetical protein